MCLVRTAINICPRNELTSALRDGNQTPPHRLGHRKKWNNKKKKKKTTEKYKKKTQQKKKKRVKKE